ncbi:hypothetical protein ES708_29182 [subsurface metagenome]
MPVDLLAEHHTIADWDFEHGGLYRALSDDHFISPPTSLKYGYGPDYWKTSVLCRIPETQCLPQGEFRTWFRTQASFVRGICFRNQAALGTANFDNCYYVYIYTPGLYFRKVVGSVESGIDHTPSYFANNEWIHYRVFWYNGFTPAEVPALCLDHYYEVDGEWVKLGDTLYDIADLWADSEINRVGFRPYIATIWYNWWDDTEIWGPV